LKTNEVAERGVKNEADFLGAVSSEAGIQDFRFGLAGWFGYRLDGLSGLTLPHAFAKT
jgi:hypothetical protein